MHAVMLGIFVSKLWILTEIGISIKHGGDVLLMWRVTLVSAGCRRN